jgi:hypothetical protein
VRPIERIGGVAPLDEDGCIANPARLDLIRDPWLAPVQALGAQCRAMFGADVHGIYVRGSVARGVAVPDSSDLDAMLVFREFTAPPLASTIQAIEADVQTRFAFVRGVDISVVKRSELRALTSTGSRSRDAFVLKTQAVCVDGIDLIPSLCKVRPGPGTMIEARRLVSSIEYVIAKLHLRGKTPEEIAAYCVWVMKILVRAAFELVQDRDRGYTRDLFPCAEIFARHHPEHADDLWKAVAWAVNPISDRDLLGMHETWALLH